MPHFHVRISQDDLTFSAAHFITLEGDTCERLHGHDYRLAVEVHGPLDENHCVIDFLALRDALRAVLDELDHRVLLPMEHPSIHLNVGQHEVEATFAERRWLFPRDDCLLLPMPNTTTELLAQHLGRRLIDELQSRCCTRPARIRVELQECCGFTAGCQLECRA
ncbi:MAG: 6-pyruvoyl tetrahydrobiopterin synthase [Planctomycetes bacterium RBG_13_63_9]|nr:MAG: 6-pyruvoyl tetrahydrobiopterin synthase [Planctomycetes bacterium RBG_13_63_9]